MTPAALLRILLRILLPLCVGTTVYLYLYPVFLGCAFPLPDTASAAATTAFGSTLRQHAGGGDASAIAPFRLLALGDPQLEGDTSIPNAYRASFPHLTKAVTNLRNKHLKLRPRVQQAMHDLVDFCFDDIPDTVESVRKRIDLFGNDFYLAHIYRTLRWWTKPSHVTVLGDLLGSQWISDAEFDKRSWRFWNRAFAGAERVPDDVAAYPAEEYTVTDFLGPRGSNQTAWRRRLINIAGNHDVGYAGDLTVARLERFERAFGKAAYELRFELPLDAAAAAAANGTVFDTEANPGSDRLPPELRIVVVNDMNLDTPVQVTELQDQTYAFVNDVINTAAAVEFRGHFTVVLTHIPLYKDEGICVDAPFFDFHAADRTLKEQNQLSLDASKGFLEGMFGLSGDAHAPNAGRGRRGVVLNGHDHEGCDVYHFINQTRGNGDGNDGNEGERRWETARWADARARGLPGRPGHPGLREVTVRSMMGEFGGNAGLLSAWFDADAWEWRYEYVDCPLGKQYFWWFVHVVDLITLVLALLLGLVSGLAALGLDADRWPGCSSAASATASASASSSSVSSRKPPSDNQKKNSAGTITAALPANGKVNGSLNGVVSKP